ncbi:MAG: GTP-binding protein [Oscillochloris sp.]|nr:GTP-binding protein [Oscillochloris sp.]
MTQLTKKISLIGDFAVGKTSLVRRFVEGRFDERYLSTIGVRVSRKMIQIAGSAPTDLLMMVWDTAGGDSYANMMLSYYRGSSGALLVCDLTRSETLTSLSRYAQEFRGVNPNAALVLIGNKVDLGGQRMVSDEQLAVVASACGAPWFLSSAKTGAYVDEAFEVLGGLISSVRSAR